LAVTALAAACSPLQDTKAADAGIAAFHQKLNASDFAGIYSGGTPALKANNPQADLVQMFAAIHRKLGAFQSGTDVGWYESLNTGAHFLTINYSARYERGAASESFVYRIDGSQAQLDGYHVTSKALILN